MAKFRADPSPSKVDLGVGVYRDLSGNTPVLASVRRAEQAVLAAQTTKSYVAAAGREEFNRAVEEMVLGSDHAARRERRARTTQTPGGCGALRVGAELIRAAAPTVTVHVSDPTWGNHTPLLGSSGLRLERYPYYDPATHRLRFDAMLERRVTGLGASLEVSLFEALAEWMGQPANYTAGSGRQPPRSGAQHATIAPYGPFTARGGHAILIAIQNEAEWARFCTGFLANPDVASDLRFATNTLRVANRAVLDKLIAERFGELDAASATALLDQAGIAHAEVNTVSEFLQHPVLRERRRWRPVQTPAGIVEALLPPIDLGRGAPRMDPVPDIGEHTVGVLAELGYSSAEITGLGDRGVI